MPTAPCAPCRERKLKCDRKPPTCSNCARARLPCPGFGKTLSWPQLDNRKRQLVGPKPCADRTTYESRGGVFRWANVRVQDVDAHQSMSGSHFLEGPGAHLTRSLLSFQASPSWIPGSLNRSDLTLVQYFQAEALLAITCGNSTEDLLGVVMRLAFHDDSPSSQAVLHAVLAVASLRRNGLTAPTIARQGAALQALRSSTRSGISGTKIAQHIATGVLMCCFEIYGLGRTAGPWYLHLRNTKGLLKGLRLDEHVTASEFLATTNWLYHHDVHAQFSLRHWRKEEGPCTVTNRKETETPAVDENTKTMTSIIQDLSVLANLSVASHRVLWPMSDIFEHVVDSSRPQYHKEEYRMALDAMERELEVLSAEDQDYFDLEVYRLAALIYLERASKNLSGPSAKIENWTDAAICLLSALGSMRHSFPIFIIGCEARTDEQRLVILDCISRNMEISASAAMRIVHDMVQSAWALDDLETESEVDYMKKLDTIISGCETMPSFA